MFLGLLSCGPGGVDEGSTPTEPEWAYGWWMDTSGLGEHPEWGSYVIQLEVRSSGTVYQVVDYCDGPDWVSENPWELQPDGSIRILPVDGQDFVIFQHPTSGEHDYVDLRRAADQCKIDAFRVTNGSETQIQLERGHWCIGDVDPDLGTCTPVQWCSEDPPTCE